PFRDVSEVIRVHTTIAPTRNSVEDRLRSSSRKTSPRQIRRIDHRRTMRIPPARKRISFGRRNASLPDGETKSGVRRTTATATHQVQCPREPKMLGGPASLWPALF